MAENRVYNDQTIVRAIRKAVERFNAAEDIDDKLKAIMAVGALGALSMISNKQMTTSTAVYIEGRLR